MAFKGWPARALEFYEGLEADNSKVYWTENKAVYDADVHAPMAALITELEEEFGPGRIFRPHRDVRFSANKAPYKTAIAATVGSGYVQLSADGLMAGAGMYHMAPDQLERYRRAVDDAEIGTGLEALVATLDRASMEVYGSDTLKTAPKGYAKDHPRIGLLRNKGLVAIRKWPPAPWLGTPGAKARVADALRVSQQLAAWLDGHVGPSALEESSRR